MKREENNYTIQNLLLLDILTTQEICASSVEQQLIYTENK